MDEFSGVLGGVFQSVRVCTITESLGLSGTVLPLAIWYFLALAQAEGAFCLTPVEQAIHKHPIGI